MSRLVAFVLLATSLHALAALGWTAEPTAKTDANSDGILCSESFEDADLAGLGWYDGTKFRVVGEATTGKRCIEYEWTDSRSGVKGSSPVRRLFEPADEVSVRFYLKLSNGWGWSGRNYHPHLTHFLTTENSQWHGPAASHLTLYIEPVGGKLRLAAQDIQNMDAPHGLTQGPHAQKLWIDELAVGTKRIGPLEPIGHAPGSASFFGENSQPRAETLTPKVRLTI